MAEFLNISQTQLKDGQDLPMPKQERTKDIFGRRRQGCRRTLVSGWQIEALLIMPKK